MKSEARDAYRFAEGASIASIVCFILVGCLLWHKLPAEVAVHFSFRGQPDDYAPRAFVVFGLPLILTGLQIVCILCARSQSLSPVLANTVLWITPGISLCLFMLLYSVALGYGADVRLWSELAVSVAAIAVGNVMPKGAANMRLSVWTKRLTSDDRAKIARFWGYCQVCCGIAMFVAALADNNVMFFSAVAAMIILPRVYVLRQVHRARSTEASQ